MTIITTEIQKWKRNKIVWCILALTLLLGAFAIDSSYKKFLAKTK